MTKIMKDYIMMVILYILPAKGGPKLPDIPRASTNNPKAFDSLPMPNKSQMIGDVREM